MIIMWVSYACDLILRQIFLITCKSCHAIMNHQPNHDLTLKHPFPTARYVAGAPSNISN